MPKNKVKTVIFKVPNLRSTDQSIGYKTVSKFYSLDLLILWNHLLNIVIGYFVKSPM